MQTVTPRQLDVLRLIRNGRRRNGYSPTMQEIGDVLGLTKVTVFEHVGVLEKKGLIKRGPKHKARSLRISRSFHFPDEAGLPLVGEIAAGMPIEAIEDDQTLDIEALFARSGELFALRVTGESMIDEQIRDGDYVICERREQAENGQTVVALLADGEATLKKFYKERKRVRLEPANPKFKPIYPRQVDIQGVVVGVVRAM